MKMTKMSCHYVYDDGYLGRCGRFVLLRQNLPDDVPKCVRKNDDDAFLAISLTKGLLLLLLHQMKHRMYNSLRYEGRVKKMSFQGA